MVILLSADQQSAGSPHHSFKRGFRRSIMSMRNAKNRSVAISIKRFVAIRLHTRLLLGHQPVRRGALIALTLIDGVIPYLGFQLLEKSIGREVSMEAKRYVVV